VVDEIAGRYFPDRPQTIVPLAISLALITRSAAQTALLAANLRGAIAGALRPASGLPANPLPPSPGLQNAHSAYGPAVSWTRLCLRHPGHFVGSISAP